MRAGRRARTGRQRLPARARRAAVLQVACAAAPLCAPPRPARAVCLMMRRMRRAQAACSACPKPEPDRTAPLPRASTRQAKLAGAVLCWRRGTGRGQGSERCTAGRARERAPPRVDGPAAPARRTARTSLARARSLRARRTTRRTPPRSSCRCSRATCWSPAPTASGTTCPRTTCCRCCLARATAPRRRAPGAAPLHVTVPARLTAACRRRCSTPQARPARAHMCQAVPGANAVPSAGPSTLLPSSRAGLFACPACWHEAAREGAAGGAGGGRDRGAGRRARRRRRLRVAVQPAGAAAGPGPALVAEAGGRDAARRPPGAGRAAGARPMVGIRGVRVSLSGPVPERGARDARPPRAPGALRCCCGGPTLGAVQPRLLAHVAAVVPRALRCPGQSGDSGTGPDGRPWASPCRAVVRRALHVSEGW